MKIIDKYVYKTYLIVCLSLGSSNAFAASAPNWVKLGAFDDNFYKINTVIDPQAVYPSNKSYELLQVIQHPSTRVKTISRSLVVDCEGSGYHVLSASLWDKQDNYIAKNTQDLLQQEDIVVLPKYIVKKVKKAVCK